MRLGLLLPLFLAAGATGQQLDVINGRVETRPASGPLSAEYQKLEASAASPMWVAYTVPMVPHQGSNCGNDQHNNIVRLEGPDTLVVLFRFENRTLDRVRVSSTDCQFDAGGLPFVKLTGVAPSQSIELLADLAHRWAQAGRKSHFDSLISAIALHREASADRVLEGMLAPSAPEYLRNKVLFWLANARGRSGFEAVKRTLQNDPSDAVRERATFALTVSKEAEAIPTLVNAARTDRSPRVRGQALFWLAQKAGREQAPVILQAAQQDPDAKVRRQAVFALKQIPNGEGMPLLIQLAKNSTDSEVRKQAVFWLGQSKDPRAQAFFDDVLK